MDSFLVDMKQLHTVFQFEFFRKIAGWRFLSCAIVAIIVFILPLITASRSAVYGNLVQHYAQPFLSSISVMITFAAVVLSFDDISSEFDNKTAYVMLTKPVNRFSFALGKMLSSAVLSILLITLYYAGFVFVCNSVAGGLPPNIFVSFGLAILYSLACINVSMLIGTFVKRNAIALAISMLFLVVSPFIMHGYVVEMMSFEPWFILSYCSGAIYHSVSGFNSVYIDYGSGLVLEESVPVVGLSAVVLIVYFLSSVIVMLCHFAYRNKL